MRSKDCPIRGGEATYTVRERKVKQNEALLEEVGKLLGEKRIEAEDGDKIGMAAQILAIGKDALGIIFPGLSPEDIEESYQSELEDLVKSWIAVNFFGAQFLIGRVLGLVEQVVSRKLMAATAMEQAIEKIQNRTADISQ